MKSKQVKHEEVESLRSELQRCPHLFLTTFDKLTVTQDFELRKSVRAVGGRYRVIKNTLAELAAEGTPAASLLKGLTGMNSLVYTDGDPVALAKALTRYAKENPVLTFKAGMIEGRVIDAGAIQQLAELPPREELLARLLFLIQAPAQRVVTALQAVGRNLAVVLDQGVKEQKFRA
jgi:large subunit ribosomal protein L10